MRGFESQWRPIFIFMLRIGRKYLYVLMDEFNYTQLKAAAHKINKYYIYIPGVLKVQMAHTLLNKPLNSLKKFTSGLCWGVCCGCAAGVTPDTAGVVVTLGAAVIWVTSGARMSCNQTVTAKVKNNPIRLSNILNIYIIIGSSLLFSLHFSVMTFMNIGVEYFYSNPV